MFPEKLVYRVGVRLVGKLKEWCLYASFQGTLRDPWVVYTWPQEPTREQVMDIVGVGFRFVDMYRLAINTPNLPEIEEWK